MIRRNTFTVQNLIATRLRDELQNRNYDNTTINRIEIGLYCFKHCNGTLRVCFKKLLSRSKKIMFNTAESNYSKMSSIFRLQCTIQK